MKSLVTSLAIVSALAMAGGAIAAQTPKASNPPAASAPAPKTTPAPKTNAPAVASNQKTRADCEREWRAQKHHTGTRANFLKACVGSAKS